MTTTDHGRVLHQRFEHETGEKLSYGSFRAVRDFLLQCDRTLASRSTEASLSPSGSDSTKGQRASLPSFVSFVIWTALVFTAGVFKTVVFGIGQKVISVVMSIAVNLFILVAMWASIEALVRYNGGDLGSVGIVSLYGKVSTHLGDHLFGTE